MLFANTAHIPYDSIQFLLTGAFSVLNGASNFVEMHTARKTASLRFDSLAPHLYSQGRRVWAVPLFRRPKVESTIALPSASLALATENDPSNSGAKRCPLSSNLSDVLRRRWPKSERQTPMPHVTQILNLLRAPDFVPFVVVTSAGDRYQIASPDQIRFQSEINEAMNWLVVYTRKLTAGVLVPVWNVVNIQLTPNTAA
jgi:hypothetical protein